LQAAWTIFFALHGFYGNGWENGCPNARPSWFLRPSRVPSTLRLWSFQIRESISPHLVIPRDSASPGVLLNGSVGGKTQNSANPLPSNAYAYGNPVNT
jgi:hypothetical protein